MTERYPEETLDPNYDDGTMVESLNDLRKEVVGHRIVGADRANKYENLVLTLDDGRQVELHQVDDCVSFTEVESFLLHPDKVDHVITGVGTTDGFTTWHIFADLGDVLELSVAWSCGNPFYYGYGFDIRVKETS